MSYRKYDVVVVVGNCFREELKVAEEGKQSLSRRIVEFEEETEVWTRIRESWNEKLREAEKTQEDHEEEIRQLKSQVLLLEQQLQLTKVGSFFKFLYLF